MNAFPNPGEQVIISKESLQTIFDALHAGGYSLIGPTLADEAIIYDEIKSISDLPIGWTSEQAPGSYRLRRRADDAYFGFSVGPYSWKRYLYPPHLRLFTTRKEGNKRFVVEPAAAVAPRYAFIGMRACELAAVAVQDRVFIEGAIQEPYYRQRREQAFFLAVNCTEPASTCFCASMNSGPRCVTGFDLALTELKESFLVEVGSPLGARMMAGSGWQPAGALAMNQARQALAETQTKMGRHLETGDLPGLLLENLDHPRWDEVATRCLSCMNCTMVCPTCFCTDVQDVSDLTGAVTERIRVWDSCFNPDFSYVHGGHLRPNVRARYRQWLTHKLASWVGQFGTSGCVGCGRCITWCPAGIDLIEEVAAIRDKVGEV
jgi:sulfhydrogenase subunit beta (sulfur reductase)